MEWIKNWVVSICSAVIFITAVELIIPDNKMDRYVKFAMGLILIAVIMNPIIKVLSNKWDMTTYINKANNYMDSKSLNNNITKYKQADKANTLNTFETNLENTSNKMLKEKFPETLVGNGIKWNFTKFLINRDGEVVGRFEPTTEPLDMEEEILKLL